MIFATPILFATPWVLLALAALPALWWLLRVTPPAPRVQDFPAVRLLLGLRAREEAAARTPWWLLLLRTVAAGLLIVGLAGPVLDAAGALPGAGPLILAIDDGWAAAPDWGARMAAANAALDRAERDHRPAALLTTARSSQDAPPLLSPVMPVAELRPRLAALHPLPWPPDRIAAARALKEASGTVIYLADGVAAAGDDAFAAALAAAGPVTEVAQAAQNLHTLLAPRAQADRLVARVASVPGPGADLAVLAQSGDGRTLARATARAAAGATETEVPIVLPPELRNRLTRLVLDGPASAGATFLLDEGLRRRPVGLVTVESGSDTPLVGALYYLDRALAPFTELRRGDLHTLLQREIAVIVLADRPVEPSEAPELLQWVDHGGLLLRFAGPRSADGGDDAAQDAGRPAADPLMPERLLAEDRQLGGALSWSQPATLAAFPATSPFAGLAVPDEVTVNRQVMAEPSAQLALHTWARLADGTPLVTEAARGSGRVVLFHVTANADWSNLPLSGLFPEMLRRLVALSAGVSATPDAQPLSPAETLDGFGVLGPPPPAATGLAGTAFATTLVSPQHPPGLYGPEAGRRALNLSNAMGRLVAAGAVPGATQQTLNGSVRERPVGPLLVAAGLALLAIDLLIALRLRGLLRPSFAALALLASLPAHAQLPAPPSRAALDTRLAYVVSGDPAVDATARAGLAGLSAYVNGRTAAHLGDPSGVQPGTDDLSFYPLLYWPVARPDALAPAAISALNGYMRDGGIIVIDSRGSPAAIRTAAAGLAIPPLTPLTTEHVLSRAFYLLSEYPGRSAGDTVWVQRQGDRSNDDVSPVVIGSHDWAAAWATDGAGRSTIAVDGGPRQRVLAYRFGVNLVIYALTGNYKGDQVHVPHILERLGQ